LWKKNILNFKIYSGHARVSSRNIYIFIKR
jgi:hypothetical protein